MELLADPPREPGISSSNPRLGGQETPDVNGKESCNFELHFTMPGPTLSRLMSELIKEFLELLLVRFAVALRRKAVLRTHILGEKHKRTAWPVSPVSVALARATAGTWVGGSRR
ncbi:hypothetical protein BDK51DRAFT_34989 [Blyttiomyces helicus]|uniref:Uncharacterized protein n=1 Tax=Blyttiomyces helicus TaxID=388810 RepID=A0A4P9WC24_9FUNG|nr:hypothetical protein BDK51DRAFT_34989 [Blyttiomyces helicus]|eukprot:RKO87886.1 hypothetical protein BDK51DRAFT_34989 [Blyttiomyces helicus]